MPIEAEDLQATLSQSRVEMFITSGKPTRETLKVTGKGLELDPVTHPNDLVAGTDATFRLLIDGKPATDLKVEIIRGGNRYRDKLGEMNLTTGPTGRSASPGRRPACTGWKPCCETTRRKSPASSSAARATWRRSKCCRRKRCAERMGGVTSAASMRRVLVPLDAPSAARLPASPATSVLVLGGETMGTTWSVKLVPPAQLSVHPLRAGIEAVLDGVIGEMSTWVADSDISRFNRAAAGTWRVLPDDFCAVLRYALRLAEESDGAYDPTIGGLVDLWGFGPHGRADAVPDDEAIVAWRAACGWQRVRLDPAGAPYCSRAAFVSTCRRSQRASRSTRCRRGWRAAASRTGWWRSAASLPGRGSSRMVSRGGSHSKTLTGTIRRARNRLVALHGLAIATSGDSQRWFDASGRRWSHTIDPRSGWPVSDRLASVTVLHRRCMQADALATALLRPRTRGWLCACYPIEPGGAFRAASTRPDSTRRSTPAMAAMLE